MKRNSGCVWLWAGCTVALVAVGLTIGALCFDYALDCIFGKDIPWYGDVVGGAVLNAIILSVAIACWIITLCGVATPFIGG